MRKQLLMVLGAALIAGCGTTVDPEQSGAPVEDRGARKIDGTEVKALEVLWKTLWAGGAPEREVTLDIVRGGHAQTLKLQSVDRMKTLKRAQGI